MPSIFVAVPVNRVRPYGIFGFGFIRQRTDDNARRVFVEPSDDDIGYSVGGGVTFQFARTPACEETCGISKSARPTGMSFQRFLVGIVLR